jgi:hypothetical protein
VQGVTVTEVRGFYRGHHRRPAAPAFSPAKKSAAPMDRCLRSYGEWAPL